MWLSDDVQFIRDRSICTVRFHDIGIQVEIWAKPNYKIVYGEYIRKMILHMERDAIDPDFNTRKRAYGLKSEPITDLPWNDWNAPDESGQGATLSRWLRDHSDDVIPYLRKYAEEGITKNTAV